MTKEELRESVAKALDIDASLLQDDSSPATIDKWDSMASLGIMLVLDDATQGDVSADDAAEFTSFGAIVEFTRRKGILTDSAS